MAHQRRHGEEGQWEMEDVRRLPHIESGLHQRHPFPRIDTMVDRTFGYKVMNFLDAFSGYHQIRMAKEDEEKTAFITDFVTYCYNVMPFGLKNAGATYQRMIDAVFKDQRGKNLEAYVDDILVKSKTLEGHLDDLRETLDTLQKFNLKLNPAKCTFDVASGKFLGYLVSARGIEVNPDKISTILSMPSPKTAKKIKKLAGRINILGRFISKAQDRCSPFFRCLRNNKGGQWASECEAAFTELKKYLTSAPILVAPKELVVLFLYLGVSDTAVSAVLVDDRKGVQHPIFYISHILLDAESRYPTLEKLALALLVMARKLRQYFQSHTIQVITDQPILRIFCTLLMPREGCSSGPLSWASMTSSMSRRQQSRHRSWQISSPSFLLQSHRLPDIEQTSGPFMSTVHLDHSPKGLGFS
ncbi:RNA-directed DNA polymerase like [Apostasia shenzhenica]|uniref:RNA-directed DNA polymerase like n=1 Tax=Apostasia shenzhenica TaxID=1088818 RepID=A0A2I0BCY5_9ASPA|nr:RNA-directed DNA polymerase like [Apostasia shenzhenica]